MNTKILWVAVLAMSLSACGRDEPVAQQEKSYGGQLGDSYKGMLEEAKQGAGDINEQMQRTDQALQQRNQ